jgi:hypothetical protein
MKLNFWQWLAVVLLIIGLAVWIYERNHPASSTAPAHATTPAPTTQTVPATQGAVTQ